MNNILNKMFSGFGLMLLILASQGCGKAITSNLWTRTSTSTNSNGSATIVTTLDFSTSGKMTLTNDIIAITSTKTVTCQPTVTSDITLTDTEIKIPAEKKGTTDIGCTVTLKAGTWGYSIKDNVLSVVIDGSTTEYTKK